MTTLYQQHVARWNNCQLCPLHHTRTKVVLVRGQLPCNILFIGEAPGASDDVLGLPFKGPPGKLLDEIIKKAIPGRIQFGEDGHTEYWVPDFTCAMTHLIGCIPKDPSIGKKIPTPPVESVLACKSRLKEIIHIASPWLIVCVGSIVKQWLMGSQPGMTKKKSFSDDLNLSPLNCRIIDILHPGEIVRANASQKTLMVKRCITAIQEECDKIPPF